MGLDMEQVERFERLMSRPKGLAHLYGERELAELTCKGRAESYAAAFCAKEAFAKALGTGVRGFRLHEVELLHDALGRPFLALNGAAAGLAEHHALTFSVSITHSGGFAAAVVVAEQNAAPGTGGMAKR